MVYSAKNVKKLRSFVVVLLALIVALAGAMQLYGCSSEAREQGSAVSKQPSDESTYNIIYNQALLNVMGYSTADEAIRDSDESNDPDSEAGYLEAHVLDDGSVSLTYSSEQYDYTLDWTKKQIESSCSSFASLYDGCSLEVDDGWQTIDCYLTPDVATSVGTWLSSIQIVEIYCAQMQTLEHPGDASWTVTISLYNVETGQLVVSASSEGGTLSFTPEDWGVSS